MRVTALIHAPFEGLGAIQTWMNKKNYVLRETHTYRGDTLPQVDDFDWLIIMGGPQNLKQLEKYAYLQDELKLITQALQKDKLILGICLGAQLIAESLGAKTAASPEREIGVFPLQLTEKGHSDPIMRHFPDEFTAMHWHNDMPGLPAGAVILAASHGCPRQIIRFKPNAYGLQCHLELTAQTIREMFNYDPDDLQPSRYTQSWEELLNHNYSPVNQWMFLFLDQFCKVTEDVGY